MMQKSDFRADSRSTSLTPSKRQKYSNYTPRKRYIKQQQKLSSYQSQSGKYSKHQSPPKIQEEKYHLSYTRNLSSSRKAYAEVSQLQPRMSEQVKFSQHFSYDKGVLVDCTTSLNSRSSLRKQKFKKGVQDRDVNKKLSFEDQNKDITNIKQTRGRYPLMIDDENLTPRKVYKKDEEGQAYLSQKMANLQSKIAKLEKMAPKRSSTPKVSRVIQNYQPQSTYLPFAQRYQSKMESISTSQVSSISQRENELMSRVSLGRLVEQQQGESEIEVIQDLSYKISSKLQSIIRNFG